MKGRDEREGVAGKTGMPQGVKRGVERVNERGSRGGWKG